MFTTSRRLFWSVSICLVFLSGSAWAAGIGVIQGEVKGPDGSLLQGADVRIERKDVKGAPMTAKTDRKGSYTFRNLDLGAYALTASANGMAPTTIQNVKARSEGAVRINFNLNQAGAAKVAGKKKATHMVWVPSDTGSNLGGRWVEVDDSGNVDQGVFNVKKAGSGSLRAMQDSSGTVRGGN